MTGAHLTLKQLLRHEDRPLPLFRTVKRSLFVCVVTIVLAVVLVKLVVP